ncbi:YCF48-related protein [Neptuniibacter sp. CAU 1671]|uniref:sialidase family protein n=1 Tax=Neptuniibacter sp. CAU 1671 TaxID=3032593 RepID=UPI0023DC13B9|nr:YCF48-related protein [Neptuniibacter sp. CAU 1671]MDF2180562.1 YCF48-related protein [Neptuniibacter sp. CAU 1671]
MNKNKIVKPLNDFLKTALLGSFISLSGCEAPLNLEGVSQEQSKAVLRTDNYQAITTTRTTEIVVGNFGVVLTRAIGEQAWQRQQFPGQPGLLDVATCPDDSVLVLTFDKHIWRSQDQAKTWQQLPLDSQENLISLTCAPDGSYWAVGSFSSLLSSHDHGETWQENSLNEDALLTSIQFIDHSLGYVSGEFGLLARTEDGGNSWTVLPPMLDEFYPQDTLFLDAMTGWAVGLDGTALRTEDGGENWELLPAPVAAPLYSLFTAAGSVYALGENATVLKYTHDGWAQVKVDAPPVYIGAGLETQSGVLLAGGKGTLIAMKP